MGNPVHVVPIQLKVIGQPYMLTKWEKTKGFSVTAAQAGGQRLGTTEVCPLCAEHFVHVMFRSDALLNVVCVEQIYYPKSEACATCGGRLSDGDVIK